MGMVLMVVVYANKNDTADTAPEAIYSVKYNESKNARTVK